MMMTNFRIRLIGVGLSEAKVLLSLIEDPQPLLDLQEQLLITRGQREMNSLETTAIWRCRKCGAERRRLIVGPDLNAPVNLICDCGNALLLSRFEQSDGWRCHIIFADDHVSPGWTTVSSTT